MRQQKSTIRRAQLAKATFETLQEVGLRNTSVARISKRAGLTQGLVHHYFQSKSEMIEAAIRLASTEISRAAIRRLKAAKSNDDRLMAIIDANLGPGVFNRPVTQAWVAFGAEAAHDDRQRRILHIIDRRLRSNLTSCLRPLIRAEDVPTVADGISMMINGAWMNCALAAEPFCADAARERVHALTRVLIDAYRK